MFKFYFFRPKLNICKSYHYFCAKEYFIKVFMPLKNMVMLIILVFTNNILTDFSSLFKCISLFIKKKTKKHTHKNY